MSEPVSATIATYLSISKLWGIASGVCGSVIPILALADRTKITPLNGLFMAISGTSFSIFVGPGLAQYLNITSLEGIIALSWVMGATGVFIIRTVLNWIDQRGVAVIDFILNKLIGFKNDIFK